MNICPKCGYEDSICWLNSHWRRYSQYCQISALENFEPEIVKELKQRPDEWIVIKPYWYRYTSESGIVNRTTEGMGLDEWRTHGFTEKPKVRKDGF